MPARFFTSVQCNLSHYLPLLENAEKKFSFSSLCFFAFFCSEWMTCAVSPHHPELPLSHISCKPKAFGHLTERLLNSIPWKFTNTAAQPSSHTTSWWEIMYFYSKTCPEVVKKKRTLRFYSNPTFLLAFHKLKPGCHRYQRVFFS